MKKELQNKLYTKYPLIFNNSPQDYKKSLIGYGIECGDGWYWLIDELCKCIQNYVDDNKKPQVVAVQLKEKLGGLRFYTEGLDNIVWGMIWFAEQLSHYVCESCGVTDAKTESPLGATGWQRTLCGKCRIVFGDVDLDLE